MENVPKYNVNDLTGDIAIKYADKLDKKAIEDIATVIDEAYGDGYCRGFNDATELQNRPAGYLQWWEEQDEELEAKEQAEADLKEYYKMSDDLVKDIQGLADELDKEKEDEQVIYGDMPYIPKEFFKAMIDKEKKDG